MFKSKTIVILAIIFLLVVLCMQQVSATADNPLSLNDLVIGGDDSNAIEANSIAANEITANEIAANSVLQPTTNTETLNDDTLPQTGVTEDITVMFFVIVCTISAIYAYKKIKEYSV